MLGTILIILAVIGLILVVLSVLPGLSGYVTPYGFNAGITLVAVAVILYVVLVLLTRSSTGYGF